MTAPLPTNWHRNRSAATPTGPLLPRASSSRLALTGSPATAPQPPTGVTASPGNHNAVVSWNAPLDNGGSVILSYTITTEPGGSTWTVVPATSRAYRFLAVFLVVFLTARFAALCFAARAARALTRFCASLARASGDSGLRFFATFFVAFAAPAFFAAPRRRPTDRRANVGDLDASRRPGRSPQWRPDTGSAPRRSQSSFVAVSLGSAPSRSSGRSTEEEPYCGFPAKSRSGVRLGRATGDRPRVRTRPARRVSDDRVSGAIAPDALPPCAG